VTIETARVALSRIGRWRDPVFKHGPMVVRSAWEIPADGRNMLQRYNGALLYSYTGGSRAARPINALLLMYKNIYGRKRNK